MIQYELFYLQKTQELRSSTMDKDVNKRIINAIKRDCLKFDALELLTGLAECTK